MKITYLKLNWNLPGANELMDLCLVATFFISPRVSHLCLIPSGQHWFRLWLVAYSVPNHYLNQCRVTVNQTLRNKVQWNFNQNTKLTKMHLKISSAKRRPYCSGGDELNHQGGVVLLMCQWTKPSVIQIMACCLLGAMPLSVPMVAYCSLDPWEQISKYRLQNDGHIVQGEMS